MKNDKLIPGMILVIIGALFLLHNFGYFYFHWENLWNMWPVFLVIAGVNLLFAHNSSPWASILKITVIIGGFALILFGNFHGRYHWWWGRHNSDYNQSFNMESDDDGSDDGDDNSTDKGKTVIHGSGDLKQAYDPSIKVAKLTLSGGAATYNLNDTTNQLFSADTKSSKADYKLTGHKEDSVYYLDFDMKGHNGWEWSDKDKDEDRGAFIRLNTNPEWDITLNAGATELKFDLSKYKLRALKLNVGAGKFNLKIGQPLQETNINVASAATDVTVEIPQNAACSIESSGLTSDNFPGFDKKDNGHYESPGFESAKNRIFIHLSGIADDFKVNRY